MKAAAVTPTTVQLIIRITAVNLRRIDPEGGGFPAALESALRAKSRPLRLLRRTAITALTFGSFQGLPCLREQCLLPMHQFTMQFVRIVQFVQQASSSPSS